MKLTRLLTLEINPPARLLDSESDKFELSVEGGKGMNYYFFGVVCNDGSQLGLYDRIGSKKKIWSFSDLLVARCGLVRLLDPDTRFTLSYDVESTERIVIK